MCDMLTSTSVIDMRVLQVSEVATIVLRTLDAYFIDRNALKSFIIWFHIVA